MTTRLRSLLLACGLVGAGLGGAALGPAVVAGSLAPRQAAASAPAAATIPPNSVTVSAGGNAYVAPDMATVSFGALVNKDNAQDAQSAVNTIITAAVANLHALGIPDRQIQTAEISLQPQYDNANHIVGYQASQTLSVSLFGLRLVGRAIDAGVHAGANNNVSVSYGLRDENAARTAALTQAVENARARAQAAATAMGRSLAGAHVQVTENGPATPEPVTAQYSSAVRAPAAAPATQTFSGTLTVHEDVTVTYTF